MDEDQSLDIDMLASSLQADSGDVRMLLKALVTRLSGALGDRLKVERARRAAAPNGRDPPSNGLHRGRHPRAAVNGTEVNCTVARSSGGIRIRSTKVTMDEWLRRLLGALRDEAASSSATRQALESIVIGRES